jgi:hypothetical protein
MKFYVQSAKTKQFLYESVHRPSLKAIDRALWTTDLNDAKFFDTPNKANQAVSRLSTATRARVVLWDGSQMWNVAPFKA